MESRSWNGSFGPPPHRAPVFRGCFVSLTPSPDSCRRVSEPARSVASTQDALASALLAMSRIHKEHGRERLVPLETILDASRRRLAGLVLGTWLTGRGTTPANLAAQQRANAPRRSRACDADLDATRHIEVHSHLGRKARTGRNPATGEAIQIAASKKIAFRAAKELKDAI